MRWCGGGKVLGFDVKEFSHNVYFANYVHSPSPIHWIYLRFVGWEDEKFSLQYTRYFIFFTWREKKVVLLDGCEALLLLSILRPKEFLHIFSYKYRMWIYYIYIKNERKTKCGNITAASNAGRIKMLVSRVWNSMDFCVFPFVVAAVIIIA